jgi:two-component system NtrC family sensor kinase
MMFIVVVVSLTPMILVGLIILREFHISYEDKLRAHLSEVVQRHGNLIDAFLNERLSDIKFLSQTCSYEQLSEETFLQERLTDLQKSFGIVFEDLGVIDHRGIQITYVGPFKLFKVQYSEAAWFSKAISQPEYISDVFLGVRGLPHFIVSVRGNHEGKPWILRATIDFMAFNSLVENFRLGKTGFAFILNKEGKFQTKPHFQAIAEKGPFFKYIENEPEAGHVDIDIYFDEASGKEIIYAATTLKKGDWVMVFQQDTEDAFFDLQYAQNIAIMTILMGGLVIVTMAILLSSITVNRIRKADREKELMNQQIIETGKLASIGELAAGIAHEINNPVAIMVEEAGWMQDLLEEEQLQKSENLEEFQRALMQVQSQGRRCKEITHKLLSFARKTDSKLQELQLNEVVEDVVELSAQRARYAGVKIETNLQPSIPKVHISQSEMQQVLLNLINNAMDAMEKVGGNVFLTTRLAGDNISLTVKDNGPGIPAANLSRIFDPFFTTKPVGKGTGLGLSICYGIIKKMGGRIDVESVVGEGTSFHILIPVKMPETESQGPSMLPQGAKPASAAGNHDPRSALTTLEI